MSVLELTKALENVALAPGADAPTIKRLCGALVDRYLIRKFGRSAAHAGTKSLGEAIVAGIAERGAGNAEIAVAPRGGPTGQRLGAEAGSGDDNASTIGGDDAQAATQVPTLVSDMIDAILAKMSPAAIARFAMTSRASSERRAFAAAASERPMCAYAYADSTAVDFETRVQYMLQTALDAVAIRRTIEFFQKLPMEGEWYDTTRFAALYREQDHEYWHALALAWSYYGTPATQPPHRVEYRFEELALVFCDQLQLSADAFCAEAMRVLSTRERTALDTIVSVQDYVMLERMETDPAHVPTLPYPAPIVPFYARDLSASVGFPAKPRAYGQAVFAQTEARARAMFHVLSKYVTLKNAVLQTACKNRVGQLREIFSNIELAKQRRIPGQAFTEQLHERARFIARACRLLDADAVRAHTALDNNIQRELDLITAYMRQTDMIRYTQRGLTLLPMFDGQRELEAPGDVGWKKLYTPTFNTLHQTMQQLVIQRGIDLRVFASLSGFVDLAARSNGLAEEPSQLGVAYDIAQITQNGTRDFTPDLYAAANRMPSWQFLDVHMDQGALAGNLFTPRTWESAALFKMLRVFLPITAANDLPAHNALHSVLLSLARDYQETENASHVLDVFFSIIAINILRLVEEPSDDDADDAAGEQVYLSDQEAADDYGDDMAVET